MGKQKGYLLAGALLLLVAMAASRPLAGQATSASPEWSFNATIVESCTCTMFCPCYFGTKPAPHTGHGASQQHYCQFNMAYKVNKGSYGTVKLDGAKFWLAGDLGDDFGDGDAEWVEISFDPAVTPEQREGVTAIVPNIYPLQWKSFTVGKDAPVSWSASKDRAEGRLDGGKAGEVVLVHNPTATTGEPTVLENLKYFGAGRNEGFVLMPNEVNAYRRGAKPFESKGTNGFMITLDITSKDVKARAPSN